MARNGCDYRQFEEFQKRVDQFEKKDKDRFLADCCRELAARLLRKVIKRTPVGNYPLSTGKSGGTLRRGWTGGASTAGANYANSLSVKKTGGSYCIEVKNPVEYASYVEFGHRTANHEGWVEGKFFLTISEEEIQKSSPSILARKLEKELRKMIHD